MNDKEYERQKNRVRRLFHKWRQPLGLGWWRLTFIYSREPKREQTIPSEHLTDRQGIWDCVFETRSDYFYKTATITAYLSIIENIKDEDLERYFLHEIMHLYLGSMKHSERGKEEELVATSLADMILWVVSSKIKLAKNKV